MIRVFKTNKISRPKKAMLHDKKAKKVLTCEQSNSFQTFLLHSHVGKTSYDAGVLYSDAACDVEMCGCCISIVGHS